MELEYKDHLSPMLKGDIKNYLIDIDGTITDDVPNEDHVLVVFMHNSNSHIAIVISHMQQPSVSPQNSRLNYSTERLVLMNGNLE